MVICGQCTQEFKTAEEELNHVCPTTGVKPTDPKTMGPNYKAIQEAAIKRGQEDGVRSKKGSKAKK